MNLRTTFLSRAFGSRPVPNVRLEVNSLRWAAVGGCDEASITAYGDPNNLWELIEFLRCPVFVRDEIGRDAWWGYVDEARVRIGALEVGATLSSLTNAVAVAYSYVQPGTQTVGQRKTTAWATDADSIAEYGRKEFLSSQAGMSDASATARRDAVLGAFRWPGGIVNPFGKPRGRVNYSGASQSQSATLVCRGWWKTTDWRQASIPSVVGPNYLTTSAAEQAVGSAAGTQKAMMVFNVGSQALSALQIDVYARKQGAPADNLVLAIYNLDSTGVPTGSALKSVSITGSGLGASLAWTAGVITEQQLTANTDYGLVISRSGAVDGTNYYAVGVNTALGYTGGYFRIYNGSAWVARAPDADMNFLIWVNNNAETTEQIRDLVTLYGEFITAVDVDAASGVTLPSYRDGDTKVMQELRSLLEAGGPNGRRLLASVDTERRLKVWEEPASTTVGYYLKQDGSVLDRNQRLVPEHLSPVGQWCLLKDVLPASADLSKLNNPEMQFIEGAAWSENNGLQLQFRGQPSIDDIGRVQR